MTMNRRPTGPRRWLPFAIAAASGFLLAFAGVAAVLLPGDTPEGDIKVPRVTGLPWVDAERRLAASGLRATRGKEVPSGDAPQNTVLAQAPAAGEDVARGTEVVLDVSEGVERVTIPALVGLSRDDAERILKEAGLSLGDLTEQPSDTARGTILVIAPAAGFTVPRGTRITATVSAGPAELAVPDVVGRDLAAARGLLEQLGFVLAPVEHDSLSTLARGTVIAQSPAAGSAAAGGSTITLRIAGRP